MKNFLRAAALCAVVATLVLTPSAFATTFIVPSDAEMIANSRVIVIGAIEGSYSREGTNWAIETVYQVRVQRGLKGGAKAEELLEVVSPGGFFAGRGTVVDGAAHFSQGEKVLLFLEQRNGRLEPLNLTLGKFRPVTATTGERLLVRDMEDVGVFDSVGKPFVEKVRREEAFLRYIQERVTSGRIRMEAEPDYLINAADVVLPALTESPNGGRRIRSEIAPWSNPSYALGFACPQGFPGCTAGVVYGMRWPTNNVAFHKTMGSDLTGAGDGGVSVIQAAMNAWTADCPAAVNLTYGGTTTDTGATNDDVRHTVEFNDPRNTMGGGTVAVTTTEFGDPLITSGGSQWWTIYDADIVFNDGFSSASPSVPTAMTHEFGHAIGFRHSNGTSANGNAQTVVCNAANEECESSATAIMFWQVSGAGFGYTLQAYDQHAVGAVYPGGSCVSLGAPTNVVATGTTTTNVNVTWTAGTGALSYNVYRSTNGTVYTLAGNTTATSFNDTVTANGAYKYKVHSVNGTESGASNTDIATTFSFTDSTITTGMTKIRHAHISELRTAVDALRVLGGLTNSAYTDNVLTSSIRPRAAHITELRTRLDAARAALGFGAATYTDTTLTTGSTKIKRVHIIDLRTALPQ